MCDVYLVVVPEPFSVSQSWGGGVTGDLQNTRINRYMTKTPTAVRFSAKTYRTPCSSSPHIDESAPYSQSDCYFDIFPLLYN